MPIRASPTCKDSFRFRRPAPVVEQASRQTLIALSDLRGWSFSRGEPAHDAPATIEAAGNPGVEAARSRLVHNQPDYTPVGRHGKRQFRELELKSCGEPAFVFRGWGFRPQPRNRANCC